MNVLILLSIVIVASMIGGFAGVFIGRLVINCFCKKGKKINLYKGFFDDLELVNDAAFCDARNLKDSLKGYDQHEAYKIAEATIAACYRVCDVVEEARA